MDSVCTAIYDRLPDHSAKAISSARTVGGVKDSLRDPSFVIAKPRARSAPYFSLSWPPFVSDVLENQKILHVAYSLKRGRTALFLCGMDDQGQTWNVDVKTSEVAMSGNEVCQGVWEFVKGFLTSARIEWRVAISTEVVYEEDLAGEWEESFEELRTHQTLNVDLFSIFQLGLDS